MPVSKKLLYLSALAKSDVRLIGEYMLREWGAVQKKKDLVRIKNSFKLISENPTIGRSRDEVDMFVK